MIGMVNAIGAGQAARDTQSARQTTRLPTKPELGEPPMWVRPPEARPSDTESVRAVRPVEFQETAAEEHVPDSEHSAAPSTPSTANSTEYAPRQDASVGMMLDATG